MLLSSTWFKIPRIKWLLGLPVIVDPMTLRQFTIFAAVARHFNVTQASKELHVSQPSISKQLRLLEESYKVKLYYRKDAGGIDLTEDGRIFLRHINVILSDLGKLRERFYPVPPSANAGSLTVGGSYGPSAVLLPSVIDLFGKSHPHTRLGLRTDSRKIIERMVLRGEVDIAVVGQPFRSPLIVSEPYRLEKLALFALPGHPLARNGNVTLNDLAQARLIIAGGRRGESMVEQALRQIENENFRLNIAARFTSPDAVKTAVRRNMGLGILYEDNIRQDLKRGDFKRIRLPEVERLAIQSYIIYRKEWPLSVNAECFRKLLLGWRRKEEKKHSSFSHRI